MRIVPLASGSSGNATLVEAGGTRLLIDAGLSPRALEGRLRLADVDPESVDALFVTHRHHDHIRGATACAVRWRAKVYATRRTARGIGSEAQKLVRRVELGVPFAVGSLRLLPIPVEHDAPETAALLVEHGTLRFGHATDLGCARGPVGELLTDCDALQLEFNHDRELLDAGSDPPHLKRRIRSDEGHLANDQAAELLEALAHAGLRQVWLAHLSSRNNRPELALAAARRALEGRARASVVVAERDTTTAGVTLPARAPAGAPRVTGA